MAGGNRHYRSVVNDSCTTTSYDEPGSVFSEPCDFVPGAKKGTVMMAAGVLVITLMVASALLGHAIRHEKY